MSIESRSTASALAGVIVFTLATVAVASPTATSRNPAKVADPAKIADAGQSHATPVSESEDDPSAGHCSKSRKRLWIEGEGWIVRKVTSCR